jgi:hypothetical protein
MLEHEMPLFCINPTTVHAIGSTTSGVWAGEAGEAASTVFFRHVHTLPEYLALSPTSSPTLVVKDDIFVKFQLDDPNQPRLTALWLPGRVYARISNSLKAVSRELRFLRHICNPEDIRKRQYLICYTIGVEGYTAPPSRSECWSRRWKDAIVNSVQHLRIPLDHWRTRHELGSYLILLTSAQRFGDFSELYHRAVHHFAKLDCVPTSIGQDLAEVKAQMSYFPPQLRYDGPTSQTTCYTSLTEPVPEGVSFTSKHGGSNAANSRLTNTWQSMLCAQLGTSVAAAIGASASSEPLTRTQMSSVLALAVAVLSTRMRLWTNIPFETVCYPADPLTELEFMLRYLLPARVQVDLQSGPWTADKLFTLISSFVPPCSEASTKQWLHRVCSAAECVAFWCERDPVLQVTGHGAINTDPANGCSNICADTRNKHSPSEAQPEKFDFQMYVLTLLPNSLFVN